MPLLCLPDCFLLFHFVETFLGTYNQLCSSVFILSDLEYIVSEEFSSVLLDCLQSSCVFLSLLYIQIKLFPRRPCTANLVEIVWIQECIIIIVPASQTVVHMVGLPSKQFLHPVHQIKQASRVKSLEYMNVVTRRPTCR